MADLDMINNQNVLLLVCISLDIIYFQKESLLFPRNAAIFADIY